MFTEWFRTYAYAASQGHPRLTWIVVRLDILLSFRNFMIFMGGLFGLPLGMFMIAIMASIPTRSLGEGIQIAALVLLFFFFTAWTMFRKDEKVIYDRAPFFFGMVWGASIGMVLNIAAVFVMMSM